MFWLSIILIIALFFGLILFSVRMNIGAAQTREAAAQALYQSQIDEITRVSTAGTISTTQAEAMRNEATRAFNRALRRGEDGDLVHAPKTAIWVVLGLTALLSLGGYLLVGLPGFPDMSLAERQAIERPPYDQALAMLEDNGNAPALAQLDDETAQLKQQLLDAIDERPDDPRGYQFLARIGYTENDYKGAAEAQQKYIDLTGDAASAADYSLLAETMILATNGYVSPEAEENLKNALRRDPSEAVALFYSAVAMSQTGKELQARRVFEAMAERGIGGPSMQEEIQRQLAELAPATGPTADDIANASDLTPEERQEMIGGMVAQLEGRLAREGGTPSDWARLINAHRVLGNTEKADAILGEARNKFPDAPELAPFDQ